MNHRDFYQHLRNQDDYNIDVTELLEELIYDGDYEDLHLVSYYVNILTRRQQIGEAFKVLQEVICQSNLPPYRKDSGYESASTSPKSNFGEIEQSVIYHPLGYEEITKRIAKTLINSGINIGTHRYERVETPLHWATREKNINLINFFIEMGIDVNAQNKRGATALHLAVINDNPDVVKTLIERGAKINIKDDEGNTPLHLAVPCENYDIVKSLLEAGANPNIFCPLGDDLFVQDPELQDIKCTSLQFAAFIGNVDLIELLIRYRADINAVCKNKEYSCLHIAVLGITCYYDTEISEKKEEEYLEIVRSLISQFPNHINAHDHESNSPLHRAVSTKHEDIIRVLLNYGASLLEFRKGGYTPFHDAVAGGNLRIVKLLLESSNDKEILINAVYRCDGLPGYSPLYVAIINYIDCLSHKENPQNILEIIKYLLSYPELDINIQDYQNQTPLHYAIEYIKEDKAALTLINELLTAKDINPFIKDCSHKTPFDYAKEDNRNKILQALIDNKYGPDKDSLLHLAADNGDSEAVGYLTGGKFSNIDLENRRGYSALHLASGKGNVKVIEILLQKGAEIDQWIGCGRTPLQIAGIKGHLDAVKLLITSGADVNVRGIDGTTIIHLVICQYINLLQSKNDSDIEQSNTLSIIKYLLSYDKLDINAQIEQKEFCDYTVNKKTVLHHLILSNVPIEQQNKKIDLIKDILSDRRTDPFIKDAESKTPIDYYIEQKEYSSPIFDQYAEIQEKRNAEIKSYKAKKYITCLLILCAANSLFIGVYASQYTLSGLILNIQNSGLMIITNIAALACCLITSKYIERSIETKYRKKVAGFFSDHTQVEKQRNYVDKDFGSPIFNELSCVNIENCLQENPKSRA